MHRTDSNISILTPFYPNIKSPYSGIFVFEQIDEMAKYYNLINVFVLRPLIKISRRFPFFSIERSKSLPSSKENIRVKELFFFPFPKDTVLYHLSISLSLKLSKRQFDDKVLTHTLYPLGVDSVLNKLKPALITHGSDLRYFIQNPKQKRVLLKALKNTNRIIAVSEGLRNDILELNSNLDVKVLYNGLKVGNEKKLDQNRLANPEVFKFVFVGAIIRQKGVYELVNAFMKFQNPNVELHIIGSGVEANNLNYFINNSHVSPKIIFHGSKTNKDVLYNLKKCHCLVLPSYKEGFGRVIIEMLREGKPVISTYSGGPEFIINKSNGLLVQPKSTNDLYLAMESIINNYSDYNARDIKSDFKNRFDIESITIKLINYLNEENSSFSIK